MSPAREHLIYGLGVGLFGGTFAAVLADAAWLITIGLAVGLGIALVGLRRAKVRQDREELTAYEAWRRIGGGRGRNAA